MTFRRQAARNRENERAGLAPVELVLSLPIWMLLASAMVIVGNLGAWKVRGHLAVREAAARSQWPRTRMGEVNSNEWSRPSAGMQHFPGAVVNQQDPLQNHTVIRGPQLVIPPASVLVVDDAVMTTGSTVVSGEAFLNEPPPLWPRSGVRSRYQREFPILDGNCGQWPAGQIGELRALRLWQLPPLE